MWDIRITHLLLHTINKEVNVVTYVHYICVEDCHDWWNSREARQNCTVTQNSLRLVEFALTVVTVTLQIPGGTVDHKSTHGEANQSSHSNKTSQRCLKGSRRTIKFHIPDSHLLYVYLLNIQTLTLTNILFLNKSVGHSLPSWHNTE